MLFLIFTVSTYSKGKIIVNISWETTTEGGLALGCILSFIFTLMTVFISMKKKDYINNLNSNTNTQHKKIYKALSFMLSYLMKVLVMFVIMSMNFWVCLCVILAQTFESIFVELIEQKRKKQSLKYAQVDE